MDYVINVHLRLFPKLRDDSMKFFKDFLSCEKTVKILPLKFTYYSYRGSRFWLEKFIENLNYIKLFFGHHKFKLLKDESGLYLLLYIRVLDNNDCYIKFLIQITNVL